MLPSKKTKEDFKNLVDGEKYCDINELACDFNQTFNEACDKYSCNQTSENRESVNCMGTLKEIVSDFRFQNVEVDFVMTEIKKIECGKSMGIDGLHPKLLKIAAKIIAKPLTMLFNKSLSTSEIPSEFKTANIFPIYKGKNKRDLNNYRPISVLPILSKILERRSRS